MALDDLYNAQKHVLWDITIGSGDDEIRRTGLAVGEGTILTLARNLGNIQTTRFTARKLHSNFVHELTVIRLWKSWNLALFELQNKPEKFTVAKLATDGTLESGDLLYNIECYSGSLSNAFVASDCQDDPVLPEFSDRAICRDYHCNTQESSPNYRVMGHIFNRANFSNCSYFRRQLQPNVPIIQVECENDDGPLFKSNGEVVGILAENVLGFKLAIHVSALRKFLDEA